MRIGILETGDVHEALIGEHGDYPSMFEKLLRPHAPDADIFSVPVVRNVALPDPGDADGWVVTGSRHGVYDDLPWIEPLKQFLRDCVARKIPIAGICFGHQILAEALGGRAEKSPKGWGLGVQRYKLENVPSWMGEDIDAFGGYALHQDQVTALPPSATRIASSDFCENAALVYGDPEHPDAISVQSHPEFSAKYIDDVIDVRLKDSVVEPVRSRAKSSLGDPVSNDEWGGWIVKFLKLAAQA